MNSTTNSAAVFVRDRGSTTSTKKRHGPAPSMRAASSSSAGMVMNICRYRKVAVAEAMSGRISRFNDTAC